MTPKDFEDLIPWCLCDSPWYRSLIKRNPLINNRFYILGWLDPEDWLEWWHLGAPVRIYYTSSRKKWIDFPFLGWRNKQLWDDTPIELE